MPIILPDSNSKYLNKKVYYEGIAFDSRREARRYYELLMLQRAGKISNLRRQVEYELIPMQRRGGKVIERKCSYIADFVYVDEHGDEIVEDAKGCRTEVYRIKRKLMLWVHGIKVSEV